MKTGNRSKHDNPRHGGARLREKKKKKKGERRRSFRGSVETFNGRKGINPVSTSKRGMDAAMNGREKRTAIGAKKTKRRRKQKIHVR